MVPDEGMHSGGGSGGSGSGQSIPHDKEPSTYIWRNKLKTPDDFALYLPKTEGMYKADVNDELLRDANGDPIPVLDAYNCHYDAYGANSNPASYKAPFTKIVFFPDLSNYRELATNEAVQVGDKITYYKWTYSGQDRQSAISHSATVTKVDANGYATEVRSKMGESYGIIFHHPRDIPESYGLPNPGTIMHNGEINPNRIYYRKVR